MKRPGSEVDESQAGEQIVKQAYGALPRVDVPSELDARVLARAHAAASKTNKVVYLQRALRRWAIPLSTAASVIVVMSVVYEVQFNSPDRAGVISMKPVTHETAARVADGQAPTRTSNAANAPVPKPAEQARRRAAANNIAPPPPVVGPSTASAMVSLPEPLTIAPPASVVSIPLPDSAPVASPAPGDSVILANELRQDIKEQATNAAAPEDRAKLSRDVELAKSSAKFASGQLAGTAARRADAMATAAADAKLPATLSMAMLAPLVGHYRYESYRIITLSGEVLNLKQLGYSAATLDIDAQGKLTQRMTLADGLIMTKTAKILEVKHDGHSGHWTVLWSDIAYPVDATIAFDANRLTSRMQFEYLSDTARFGNVELATLRRVAQ